MKHRFQALDSWRGICALIVAAGHLPTAGHISAWGVVRGSAHFVDFFFVLSGFVIAYAYREQLATVPGALRSFAIRRFGRLWPLHFFMLLAFIAFELAILIASHAGFGTGRDAFTDKDQLATLPANILLIQAWGIYRDTSWNIPAWSISTEIFAYGCYAFSAVTLGRHAPVAMGVLALVGVVVVATLAPEGMGATADFGLARCLFGFGSGVLVETAWRRMSHIRLPAATILEIVVCAGTFLVAAYARGVWAILIVPSSALLVFVFAYESGAISRLLRRPAAVWAGERSYSIYLIHALIVQGVLAVALIANKMGAHLLGQRDGFADGHINIVGNAWALDGLVILYIGAVLLVATITYSWVEIPGRTYFNRLAGKPRPVAPVGAP